MAPKRPFAETFMSAKCQNRNHPNAKPLDARAVRFPSRAEDKLLSLGGDLATSRAYLANSSVTS